MHAETIDTTKLCFNMCNCSDLHLKNGESLIFDRFIYNFPLHR